MTKYQNGPGIDNKLKLSANGVSKYFLADHLGSTNALTDSSGNVTSSATYDSFGNASGNLATRYKFTGREYDEFTGLDYYRARWYDSNLGRSSAFKLPRPSGRGSGRLRTWASARDFRLRLSPAYLSTGTTT